MSDDRQTARPRRVSQDRSREEVDALLHYGHPIPVFHGFTDAYVAKTYPGWTWNELIGMLHAADVVVMRGGSPPCCKQDVVRVELDALAGWRVTWADGRIAQGPTPPGMRIKP